MIAIPLHPHAFKTVDSVVSAPSVLTWIASGARTVAGLCRTASRTLSDTARTETGSRTKVAGGDAGSGIEFPVAVPLFTVGR